MRGELSEALERCDGLEKDVQSLRAQVEEGERRREEGERAVVRAEMERNGYTKQPGR